jgi:hypothetical protein
MGPLARSGLPQAAGGERISIAVRLSIDGCRGGLAVMARPLIGKALYISGYR